MRRGSRVDVIGAVCSHLGALLEEGKLVGDCVECPWHYSLFSLEDGSYQRGPTTAPVPAYDARINNGYVEIRRREK